MSPGVAAGERLQSVPVLACACWPRVAAKLVCMLTRRPSRRCPSVALLTCMVAHLPAAPLPPSPPAYEKGGQFEKALKVFQQQLDAKVDPDLITFGSLVSACERAGAESWQSLPRTGSMNGETAAHHGAVVDHGRRASP